MIKTGDSVFGIDRFSHVRLIGESDFTVYYLREVESTGELERDKVIGISTNRELKFSTKEQPITVEMVIGEGVHWSGDIEQKLPFDKVDSVPFEVPEELKRPETLEQKLQRMMASMVSERYGRDSAEYETFEDSMDFDVDDELAMPLSDYEFSEMQEDFVEPVAESNESEAKPAESSATPSPEAPQADPEAPES